MRRSVQFLAVCAGLIAGSAAHAKDLPGFNAIAGAPTVQLRADLAKEAAKAGGSIGAIDNRTGVPAFMWAVGKHAAPALVVQPEAAAQHHAARFARAYGLSPAALGTAFVARKHDMGRGAVIVTLRQRIDGIEVYRSDMNVLMRQNLELVSIGGSLHPAATPVGKPGTRTFKVAPAEALAAAFKDLYGIEVPASAMTDAGRS